MVLLQDKTPSSNRDIWFVSLGLLVLDRLEFPDRVLNDVIGGSGTYATLGARIFRPPPASSSIGWLLRIGNDFPDDVISQLESWQCSAIWKRETNQPSTRGCLSYRDELGMKTFEYLTPLLTVSPSSFVSTMLLHSRSFHLLASPAELMNTVPELLSLREEAGIIQRPLIIWEPRPSSCIIDSVETFIDAIKHVDVFSPNHIEFAQIFETANPEILDRKYLEHHANLLLNSGIGPDGEGIVVVRAAETGCMVVSRERLPYWSPPFYDGKTTTCDSAKMDSTGAGNAFLGAFTVGLLETSDLVKAASYGSVGASFALEQTGLPTLQTEAGMETWNGVVACDRLAQAMSRPG